MLLETTLAYQVVRNVRFLKNFACFVFLKHPFWYSPFSWNTHFDIRPIWQIFGRETFSNHLWAAQKRPILNRFTDCIRKNCVRKNDSSLLQNIFSDDALDQLHFTWTQSGWTGKPFLRALDTPLILLILSVFKQRDFVQCISDKTSSEQRNYVWAELAGLYCADVKDLIQSERSQIKIASL